MVVSNAIFAGYLAYDFAWSKMGWDHRVHHLLFLAASAANSAWGQFPFAFLWLICGEASTVPLSAAKVFPAWRTGLKLAFVPVFVNVLRGLRQTRPVHRDLLRATGATGAQTFRVLTLPTATPYLMTGIRIASSIAVIAALVAEYFGGPADGIGTAIASYAKSGRAALAFAYVAGGIAIGLALFLVTSLLERLVSRRPPG